MPSPTTNLSISAFFPAYNDAGTIASMVVTADRTLREITDDYEVIVVNDGSPDHTGEVLADLQKRYPKLRVVTHQKNRGYGGALRSGFANASKSLVCYTDGDAQYDPREFKLLAERLTDDVDVVQGYKIQRHDPLERIIIGKLYHTVVRTIFSLPIRDVDCDFRLIRRKVFDEVTLTQDSGVICVEMMTKISQAGFKITEVPVHHYHRAYGKSQFFNVRRVGRVGVDLLKLWVRLVLLRGLAGQRAARAVRGELSMPYRVGRFYERKRVMVTGGVGFIGSNLARALVDLGAEVLLVDSLIAETGANLANIRDIADRVSTRTVDVRDALAMERLVRDQDIIFNLAGQVSHIDSMRDPFTDLDINCRAQLSLLEACRHHNPRVKVIFASTRQIYGRPDYVPVDEKHLLHPTDVNGINKMAGEWYHVLYNNVYGVRGCSLRLTNTYGPRMLVKNNRQTAIGWFIKQIVDAEEVQLFGDGSQLRDFTYVDDVCDAFLRAGASDVANGQVFNIGGPEPISLRDLLELMIEIAGRGSYRLVPFPEEKRAIDIGSVYADDSKIRRALGWEPRVGLREGLARTIRFYLEHRDEYWGEPAMALGA